LENQKKYSTLLFSRFGKPEKFRKLFAKEEEEEVQEDVQRDSKVVKEYVENLFVKVVKVVIRYEKCKSRSCFYILFMFGQENHWKSYDLEKNLKNHWKSYIF